MSNIKKSMVAVLAFITENGKMSKENLAKFTNEFCISKSGSESNGPRELTVLRDEAGNMLGRKCTVTGLWFEASYFSKNTTCNKEADAVRAKFYNDSKKMEKEALSILDDAKALTDVMDKVAKYEEYDSKLSEAKLYRNQPIIVTDSMKLGGFETIDELAESIGVELPADSVE
ncbi:MAG: hypothetical protein JHC33_11485 [Ignisphaera sp.]|nr:hypothetical protein [Ignisphaera sp.]